MSNDHVADDQATALVHQTVPFAAELGIEVLHSAKQEVRTRLVWQASRCTAGGALHGGVLMALADTTGATVAFLNLPDGAGGTTTVESKTNFLRAVRTGHVIAVSRPLHVGRRIIVVETELRDDSDQLVAKTTQSQAVLQ